MDVYTSVVMAATGRIIAAGLVLAGSLGCGPSFNWEGTWKGERNVVVTVGTPAPVAVTVKRVILTVQGGEFSLIASGIPRKGVFRSSGKSASLETVLVFSRPAEKPQVIQAAANPDGTITLQTPDDLDPNPIVLRRESQPQDSSVRRS